MAATVATSYANAKVGVIGTKGTIGSDIYPQKIKALNPAIQVVSKATPLLAPLVEENFDHSEISQLVLSQYLHDPLFENIKGLVLGCTHYPLLKEDILAVLPSDVAILDSSEVVAKEIQEWLTQKHLLNSSTSGSQQFFVSDYTPAFAQMANHFFGKDITLHQLRIHSEF